MATSFFVFKVRLSSFLAVDQDKFENLTYCWI
jgi:hypothetical protein